MSFSCLFILLFEESFVSQISIFKRIFPLSTENNGVFVPVEVVFFRGEDEKSFERDFLVKSFQVKTLTRLNFNFEASLKMPLNDNHLLVQLENLICMR